MISAVKRATSRHLQRVCTRALSLSRDTSLASRDSRVSTSLSKCSLHSKCRLSLRLCRPTAAPTQPPTAAPTAVPTAVPSAAPTASSAPSLLPTADPTPVPTTSAKPTTSPTTTQPTTSAKPTTTQPTTSTQPTTTQPTSSPTTPAARRRRLDDAVTPAPTQSCALVSNDGASQVYIYDIWSGTPGKK